MKFSELIYNLDTKSVNKRLAKRKACPSKYFGDNESTPLILIINRINDLKNENDIENGIRILKILLKYGANLEAFDNNGLSALHFAVQFRLYRVVKILLSHGIDINLGHPTSFNGTPLVIAIRNDDVAMVKLLVDSGADINNIQDDFAFSIAKKDLKFGRSKKYGKHSALNFALVFKKIELAKYFVEKGCDLKRKISGEYFDSFIHALDIGDVDLIKVMLKTNIDLNYFFKKNSSYQSPLTYLILCYNYKLVKLLLENNADANYLLPCGFSPLQLAVLKAISAIQENDRKDIISINDWLEKVKSGDPSA